MIMSHIELLGPPGAGKSTLLSALVANENSIFGGLTNGIIRRAFRENIAGPYIHLYEILPEYFKMNFEKACLQYRYGYRAFESFVSNFPEATCGVSVALEEIEKDHSTVMAMFQRAVREYQLGMSTKTETEELCLDEGFTKTAVAASWRTDSREFLFDSYFSPLPKPKAIIFVDASNRNCIDRQISRGRTVESSRFNNRHIAIDSYRKCCQDVIDFFLPELELITIENNSDIESTISCLEKELSESRLVNFC